jgi:acyl-coenzyme A synthetase/AMP-(fatty) acid ligase
MKMEVSTAVLAIPPSIRHSPHPSAPSEFRFNECLKTGDVGLGGGKGQCAFVALSTQKEGGGSPNPETTGIGIAALDLQPVPPGVIGDLYIHGVGLSPGYWKNDEKTREAFVYPPGRSDAASRMYRTGDLARLGEDGLVYFIGRADSQVKSRGHRIELGEIETALLTSPELADCTVVALPSDGFEGATICCAFVAARDASPTPASLRRFLKTRLPSYMLPSRWLASERLPTNANGKNDRKALKELFLNEADRA